MRLETRISKTWDRTPAWLAWVLAVAALFVVGGRGLQALGRNYWDLRQVRAEGASLQAEQAALTKRLELLKSDDAHLERVARKELGLMKPGEIEYRFKPAPSANR
jgi:cell division protein FtsB